MFALWVKTFASKMEQKTPKIVISKDFGIGAQILHDNVFQK
jgi:hypothetical protein